MLMLMWTLLVFRATVQVQVRVDEANAPCTMTVPVGAFTGVERLPCCHCPAPALLFVSFEMPSGKQKGGLGVQRSFGAAHLLWAKCMSAVVTID